MVNQSARVFFSTRQFRPDLILLSDHLPGKPSHEIARELSQDVTLRDTPIILLTATVSPAEGNPPSLQTGERIFLTKSAAAQ